MRQLNDKSLLSNFFIFCFKISKITEKHNSFSKKSDGTAPKKNKGTIQEDNKKRSLALIDLTRLQGNQSTRPTHKAEKKT